MPFGEHLEELRRRLIIAMWGVVPILILSFYFGKDILRFIIIPILSALQAANIGSGLQATGPLETFMTYFKVALTVTVLLASPWILFQLWMFVAPGLYSKERRFAYILAPLSFLLTLSGVTFCFKVMLPVTLFFLATFGSDIAPINVKAAPLPAGVQLLMLPVLGADPSDPPLGSAWINTELHQVRVCVGVDPAKGPMIGGLQISTGGAIAQQYRLSEYVSLLLAFCIAFALSFQMPVLVLLLGWANIVQIPMLTKFRKHSMFVSAFLGAFLTPTGDPFTMFLLAGPIYLLYELGIILLRILPASRVAGGFSRSNRTPETDDEDNAT